jgi:hypothetical protein
LTKSWHRPGEFEIVMRYRMESKKASGLHKSINSAVRYFVAAGNNGGWLVFREGIQRPVRKLAEKLQAVETAKFMARDEAPSQVFVERADGSFFERYAFKTGHAH